MKKSLIAFAAAAFLTGTTLGAQQQAPPPTPQAPPTAPAPASSSPAGKWVMAMEGPQGAMSLNLDVKVDPANKVTGTFEGPSGASPIKGEVKDGVLGFSVSIDAGGNAMELWVEGKINPEGKMTGTLSVGELGSFPFVATRAKGL
jgi:hypothetical protein